MSAKTTKAELVAQCGARGIPISGNKDELVARIAQWDAENGVENVDPQKVADLLAAAKTKVAKVPKTAKRKAQVVGSDVPIVKRKGKAHVYSAILKTAYANVELLPVRRNIWGNYEHAESHVVFDVQKKVAVGIQTDGAKVRPLDIEATEWCKENGIGYRPPANYADVYVSDPEVADDDLAEME